MSRSDLSFSDEEFGEMLRSIDHPAPAVDVNGVITRARRGRMVRRAALLAAAAVLAVATVSTATMHGAFVARILDRIRGTSIATRGEPSSHATTATTNAARGVSFTPAGEVEVDFRSVQQAGVLRTQWVNGGPVRLSQTGAEGEAHYTLTPAGVIVDNEHSTASYTLVLPRSAVHARVRVAAREVLSKNGDVIACEGAHDASDGCTIGLTGELKP